MSCHYVFEVIILKSLFPIGRAPEHILALKAPRITTLSPDKLLLFSTCIVSLISLPAFFDDLICLLISWPPGDR